jgi:flavin-dependent dehydrogenase
MFRKNYKSQIAIAGAGMTGAYLYRLLQAAGVRCDLYEIEAGTRCSLTACAWGTSRGFCQLVAASGLDPEKYILQRLDHLMMDEVKIKAEVMTFDKPRLIKDLLKGADVKYTPLEKDKYDRIIDATGVTRAFLPTIEDDIILGCVQHRIATDEPLNNQIRLGRIGYAWCFPLAGKGYHVGCGSLAADPRGRMQNLGWLQDPKATGSNHRHVCECKGSVRLTSPQYSRPFVANGAKPEVWGVGEAIGCVAPLAGDGVVPGMKSVQILLSNWEDPDGYTRSILEEFGWMAKERSVIDKLRKSHHLGMADAWVLKENSKRMGMKVGIREAFKLVMRLR